MCVSIYLYTTYFVQISMYMYVLQAFATLTGFILHIRMLVAVGVLDDNEKVYCGTREESETLSFSRSKRCVPVNPSADLH